MQAVHFNADGKEIPAHEASRGANLVGFCSWRRLVQLFRDAKEIGIDEELASFQVDDRGITYRVR